MKRVVAMLMVLLLSIESFGAIVSDNDGSAFITKAEFDSLKNDFQSQIDQYNTSIDSKIDGAIAAYLAGIRIETKTTLTNLYNQYGGNNITWLKNSTGWPTGTQRPQAELAIFLMCWPHTRYWSKYKYCYYRFKQSDDVIIAEDETKGGGVVSKIVNNANALTPSKTTKGFLIYENSTEMKALKEYRTYAPLYEAWAMYFNNNDPADENATVVIDFANVMTNKNNTGTITFTNASRESSGCRVNDKSPTTLDASYWTFCNKMDRQIIMISTEEFGKKSKMLGNWTSDLSNADIWQKLVSPDSTSSLE